MEEYIYPLLPLEILAIRNGVAPVPSAARLMLTVLHLDAIRAELEAELAVLGGGGVRSRKNSGTLAPPDGEAPEYVSTLLDVRR
jgi:hypothetical protein